MPVLQKSARCLLLAAASAAAGGEGGAGREGAVQRLDARLEAPSLPACHVFRGCAWLLVLMLGASPAAPSTAWRHGTV